MVLSVESYLENVTAGQETIEKAWDEIPLLSDILNHEIYDGKLLRFRGMVQDMPNPVYYYEEYSVQNTLTGEITTRSGKYRDGLVCQENEKLLLDSDNTVSSERTLYYCVNVPCLNAWARVTSKVVTDRPMLSTLGGAKRPVDDMEVDDEGTRDVSKRPCTGTPTGSETVQTPSETDSQATQNSITHLHCPVPTGKDTACVVHVYDVLGEDLKVNDIVDVVGFTYVTATDQDEVNIPPSLAPRLHAVALKRPSHDNPFIREILPLHNVESIRSELHLALTQLLLGDHLAADYAICHLLSNVYSRRDVVLGKFSLNLSNVPVDPSYTEGVYDILSNLVPKSHFFSMSLQNMNATDLVPIKDYETNRLKSGLLQLSDRTHFVIDETKLEAGKLMERGVKNVQVLNTLLSEQAVHYDFKFYSIPFPMNVPVLVFSEGKSLLQCDTHVKLVPDSSFCGSVCETLESVKSYLREPLLSTIRAYLTVVAAQQFTLPDDLVGAIQEDFVSMRQANSKISPDELHLHLVLARLLCLSLGRNSLTKDVWDRASELERLRRARL